MEKRKILFMNFLLGTFTAREMTTHSLSISCVAIMVFCTAVAELPYINARAKESLQIVLPLIVAIVGLTIGLVFNFSVGNYAMEKYCYCAFAAIIGYLSAVVLLAKLRGAFREEELAAAS